jgi:hypothetical protein
LDKIDGVSFYSGEIFEMNTVKMFAKKFIGTNGASLTKFEVKMNRKVQHKLEKRVRDKHRLLDRHLKVIWSE